MTRTCVRTMSLRQVSNFPSEWLFLSAIRGLPVFCRFWSSFSFWRA